MARSYASTIINASADEVWARIRDFNGLPNWAGPAIEKSELEGGLSADTVGVVRQLTLGNGEAPAEQFMPYPGGTGALMQKLVKEQVKPWNGHVTLTGEEVNVLSGNTAKRLPVTFESEAVFGLGDAYDNIVIVHPSSVQAGTPGQKIDAGNYYVNKGPNYPGDEKVIAAHEYGHLIGIPDEYSQSNEQMNALLHQAAPTTAPSAQAALDRKTVQRMVLLALRLPLLQALDSAMASATDSPSGRQRWWCG